MNLSSVNIGFSSVNYTEILVSVISVFIRFGHSLMIRPLADGENQPFSSFQIIFNVENTYLPAEELL